MRRANALSTIYAELESCVVVTIMGAVAAELHALGHRPNFFYLEHAMGLASSMGLGIALSHPELTTFHEALQAGELTTLVAKVVAEGPASYWVDVHMLENRFAFQRSLSSLRPPTGLR